MKRLFIFDVDGTLVDSYRAIWESLNATRQRFGYEDVSLEKTRRSVGHGDIVFIDTFFRAEDREKALRFYRRHHRQSLLQYVRPLPFSRYMLSLLKRRKRYTAIASNRPTVFTRIILKKAGLEQYIDYVLCADTVKRPKPDPAILLRVMAHFGVAKKETLFVGDMDIDIRTARRAGVDSLFLKGGSTPVTVIKKTFRTIKIISSLKEVITAYD